MTLYKKSALDDKVVQQAVTVHLEWAAVHQKLKQSSDNIVHVHKIRSQLM